MEADLTDLRFASRSFDFVFCYGVITSVVKLLPSLREFHRLLRPGGSIYVVLNGRGWGRHLRDEAGEKNPSLRHHGIAGLYNTICSESLGRSVSSFSNTRLKLLTEPEFLQTRCKPRGGDAAGFADVLSTIRKTAQISPEISMLAFRLAQALDPSTDSVVLALSVLGEFMVETGEDIHLAEVCADVAHEYGAKHVARLLGDVACLLAGHNFVFSEFNGGRNYGIEEVKRAVELSDFANLRHASEGQLRCPDFAKRLPPLYPAPSDGALKVWEFMADKA